MVYLKISLKHPNEYLLLETLVSDSLSLTNQKHYLNKAALAALKYLSFTVKHLLLRETYKQKKTEKPS